jgi:beta-galactosidase
MKSRFVKFMLSAAALAIFSFSAVHAAGELSFAGENGEEFVIAGRSVQIRAGELEPQRIPREYWRHRVQMCKAMGLNAVSSYFMWNDFERPDGSFDFKTGSRDVAAFLEICRQEGMWVLFRPGPYVCGEWDFGGLPSRLLKDDIAVRSTDPRYLNEAMKYLSAIADVAEPFLAKNGGPIILTQIENEYGSWPFKDAAYLRRLKDFWKRRGFSPFYMADGAGDRFLKDLIYPDREIAVGFDPGMNEKDWSFARKYNPGVPIFSSETYPGWLRHWGESSWRPSDISETIRWYMKEKKSFCIFVAHGGTSFGFSAGANDGGEGGYEPDLTSYDYGSPIDEQGRPAKEYFSYRKIIYDALGEVPPPVPRAMPCSPFKSATPEFYANLRDGLETPRRCEKLESFEAMGQNQGMAIYRTVLPAGDSASLSFEKVADYAQVWLGGRRIATIDRRKKLESVCVPARTRETVLEIVVEAMGHINFGKGMRYDRKGIVGDVWLGGMKLSRWTVSLKPLTEESVVNAKRGTRDAFSGGHYRATVTMENPADTFIDMSKWVKGTVYVNGRNIGRYWNIGPQLSLYCPAPFLKKGENTIDIIDLEVVDPKPVRGLSKALYIRESESTRNAANVW